jgi:hypothetical protein
VLLTALTEREWVKEDDLASDLQLHPKMVRRALRYLEHVSALPSSIWGGGGGCCSRLCPGKAAHGSCCTCQQVTACVKLGCTAPRAQAAA